MELKSNKLLLQLIGGSLILIFIASIFQERITGAFMEGWNNASFSMENPMYRIKLLLESKAENHAQQTLFLTNGKEVQLENIKGSYYVHFDIDLEKFPFYLHIVFMVALIVGIILLISMIRFIRNMVTGDILNISTCKSLLYLGLCLIVFAILDYIFCYIQLDTMKKLFIGTDYIVRQDFGFDFTWVMGGLIFLAVSVGIKVALQIKEENELTV